MTSIFPPANNAMGIIMEKIFNFQFYTKTTANKKQKQNRRCTTASECFIVFRSVVSKGEKKKPASYIHFRTCFSKMRADLRIPKTMQYKTFHHMKLV